MTIVRGTDFSEHAAQATCGGVLLGRRTEEVVRGAPQPVLLAKGRC